MSNKWKILIAIIIMWILGGIGLIINIYQQTPPEDNSRLLESVKIALLILGGLGVVLPTYLNIWQSLENSSIVAAQLQFQINENTIRLIEMWDNPNLFEARKFTRNLKDIKADLSPNEIKRLVDSDPILKQSVILVFNYFENVRVSLECKRVNEEILKSSLGPVFRDLYERFLPWLKTQEPAFINDLDKLHMRWLS